METIDIILLIAMGCSVALNSYLLFIVLPNRYSDRQRLTEIIINQALENAKNHEKMIDAVARCNAVIAEFNNQKK